MRYQSFLTDNARWDGFELRPGDIIISVPAKSGTTWMQTICALLIFQTPEFPASIDELSPWLEMRLRRKAEVWEMYRRQTNRRFIKSHTPFDGLPTGEGITYLCVGRDPRDVALSWNNHMENLELEKIFATLAAALEPDDDFGPPPPRPIFDGEREAAAHWVDDDWPLENVAMSLAGTIHHLKSFWDVRDRDDVVLLHYDDLQVDLEGEMRRLAGRLGIEVPEERWPALVKAATFSEMRGRPEMVAPDTANAIWKSTADFFKRGTSGQWSDVFDADLQARYEAKLRELAPADLIEWLHPRGLGGVPPTEAA
ncbi:MAG: sulfotransferase domain-containing protein [Actinobacteria bacterium]|nr:sulfotransferase domain-containing protein [Actinomycetota bacterium]